jgi:hypothetical protein
MLKFTVAALAFAFASSASAAGWKSLRVDGSSEAAFAQSLEAFKEKLSPVRRYVFGEALKDIWLQGTKKAEAEQREYTASDYYRQVDGLGYEEIVTLTDPTGETARQRRTAFYRSDEGRQLAARVGPGGGIVRSLNQPAAPIGPHGEQVRGTVDTGPAYQHQQRQMGQ